MKRVAELDALRGLAAVAIMVYHLRFHPIFFGWTRVEMFFVLSGFLGTVVTLKYGRSWRFAAAYFARRLLRVGPMYFAGLLVLLAAHRLLPGPVPTEGLAYYALMMQNVPELWGGPAPIFSDHFFHTWSLALEVRFALIWPALVLCAGRRRLVPLCLLAVAASAGARACGVSPYLLLGRLDGFALGGLLAELVTRPGSLEAGRPALCRLFLGTGAAASAVIAWGIIAHWGTPVPWPSLTILAAAAASFSLIGLVICHAGHPALVFLRVGPLPTLGRLSFGIYLFHPIVFWVTETVTATRGIERGPWLELAMLAASLAASALSWRFLESPALSLKDRVPYQPAGHPPAVKTQPAY